MINIEYKGENGEFGNFFTKIASKKVAVMYDANTQPYALAIKEKLSKLTSNIVDIYFEEKELIPDEKACGKAKELASGANYLLAVGSGTLNDMAKAVSASLNIECGVLATAASMDGYASKGAALMRGGVKVTDEAHSPSDILIDLDIVCGAPKIMTAAGFGDIMGKYTCLTDWQLSNIINGEEINEKAYKLMEKALTECMDSFENLTKYKAEAVASLMSALITAGLSMAECGNSRPASGSEHHMSHFLEMDFIRRGEKVPFHGIKVAIGTLISIELYNYIKDNHINFAKADKVLALIERLPKVEAVKSMLNKMGCPVRFSEIGVRKETMEEMLEKAYLVRDRYTVLTLIHNLGLTKEILPIIMKKYF